MKFLQLNITQIFIIFHQQSMKRLLINLIDTDIEFILVLDIHWRIILLYLQMEII